MRYFKLLITSVLCLTLFQTSFAHINTLDQGAPASTSNTASLRTDCDQATSQIDMEINQNLISWIMSHGNNMEVIGPKKLRKLIKEEIKQIVKMYG